MLIFFLTSKYEIKANFHQEYMKSVHMRWIVKFSGLIWTNFNIGSLFFTIRRKLKKGSSCKAVKSIVTSMQAVYAVHPSLLYRSKCCSLLQFNLLPQIFSNPVSTFIPFDSVSGKSTALNPALKNMYLI